LSTISLAKYLFRFQKADPSSPRTSNEPKLFLPVLMLADITFATSTMAPFLLSQLMPIFKSSFSDLKIRYVLRTKQLQMLQQSHLYLPILLLVASNKSTEIFNPKPVPLQLLQCAMYGQLKSSHPSGCPNYGVTFSACGIAGHNLVFCCKVMASKKSSTTTKRNKRILTRKNGNLKIRRHLKKKKPSKPKKANMATDDLTYDSDAHVYMSRITSEAINLTEDSERPPSPAVHPSPEVPPLSYIATLCGFHRTPYK